MNSQKNEKRTYEKVKRRAEDRGKWKVLVYGLQWAGRTSSDSEKMKTEKGGKS